MDAEKYIKENHRMCDSYSNCAGCPMMVQKNNNGVDCTKFAYSHPSEAVEVIEKWSKEHPIMTNAMKFKEVFGCEPLTGDTDSHKYLCAPIEKRADKCPFLDCRECDEWWDREYKEPANDK